MEDQKLQASFVLLVLALVLQYKATAASTMSTSTALQLTEPITGITTPAPTIVVTTGSPNAICPSNPTVLSSSFGTFSSPNYPKPYPHNVIKTWKITAPVGNVIDIYFEDFKLEGPTAPVCSDYLKISNECDEVSIATYCGYHTKPVRSRNNVLWIEFRSDSTINDKGFRAIYQRNSNQNKLISCPRQSDNQASINYCLNGGEVQCCTKDIALCKMDMILTARSGIITSPRYPFDYPANTVYRWRITAPEGYVVQLNFTTLITYHTSSCTSSKLNCNCDFVQAHDGPCMYNIGTRWCGGWTSRNLYPSYITTGRHMFVAFKSDSAFNHVGFKAKFRWALKCGGGKPYSCLKNSEPACCKTQDAHACTTSSSNKLWVTMVVMTTALLLA